MNWLILVTFLNMHIISVDRKSVESYPIAKKHTLYLRADTVSDVGPNAKAKIDGSNIDICYFYIKTTDYSSTLHYFNGTCEDLIGKLNKGVK